jgi:hypothetical protein
VQFGEHPSFSLGKLPFIPGRRRPGKIDGSIEPVQIMDRERAFRLRLRYRLVLTDPFDGFDSERDAPPSVTDGVRGA